MERSSQANHRKVLQLLKKNKRDIPANSVADKENYIGKIETLSEMVDRYCVECEEIGDFQRMLLELANDLPLNANPCKAVHRSIKKRFQAIIKHLQSVHGLSLPHQFREAGIVIGAALLGMAGFIVMAFNMNFLYPLAGLLVGGLGGYLWGIKRDRKAHEEGTVIDWKE
ncbi:MAG: hypothetical protein K9I68_08675 [Bacteroidales bacterium]|nr:hypothetical protein [Bacteroidales bacterium]MCF8338099.1 hypothetical protein [Bacteroidales bacterium]